MRRSDESAAKQKALQEGRRKALLFKNKLAANKEQALNERLNLQSTESVHIAEDSYVDSLPRRKNNSTGSRLKPVTVDNRRETIASSTVPHRTPARPAIKKDTTFQKPTPSEASPKFSGWEGRAEDCYTNEELRGELLDPWEDQPSESDNGPHFERIISPFKMAQTAVAIAALALLLSTSDVSSRHMTAGIFFAVFAEFLCDYALFQFLSGLSLGFVFAVIVVLLFVIRRYTKPTVVFAMFSLGLSRLNVVVYVLSPLASALGLSVELFVKLVLSAAAILMFIFSSIWYCTASFPVENFKRFIKFFFSVIVGGSLISYSYFPSQPGQSMLGIFLSNQTYYNIPQSILDQVWLINSLAVFGICTIFLRVKCISHVYEDIQCIVNDHFGETRVEPVGKYCIQRSPAEAKKICRDFTKKQLQMLNEVTRRMSDEELKNKLSPEGYFQIQKQKLNDKQVSYLIWCLMTAGAAVICWAFFLMPHAQL